MGSFYANVTVIDAALDDVRAASPRPAFVAADGPHVVVFAEAEGMGELVSGAALSAAIGGTAVSTGVHDDDVLFWEVHRAGQLVASGAVPDPAEVFDEGEPGPDPTILATELAAALGRPDATARLVDLFTSDHVFASDLHASVVRVLGLAPAAVGWGYRYLAEDPSGPDLPTMEHLGP